jgi:D-3-phosphoglycerate dehydrogenase
VIADNPFEDADKEQALLARIGATVRKFNCRNESEVLQVARDADVIMCDAAPITRDVISMASRLVGIVEYGIGYDNIDVQAATAKGIVVCNVPDFMTSEVADHSVALILALARKLHLVGPSTRAGEWNWRKFKPMSSLDGKTAGIVGFGGIGRQVAERLRVFRMQLLAYDPYIRRDTMERVGVKSATLDELLKASDVLSIHVPLTKETRGIIGPKQLALMKSSAILVNTSRGAVVDQNALFDFLRRGRIAAAGLDVLAKEPPDSMDPLLALDNVIVTPHIAWYSEESTSKIREYAALEAERILTHQAPKHPVNPQVLAER